jgi:hypothetical protein
MCDGAFIYVHKKGIAFPAPILTELTNAQEHYEISYTQFNPHQAINIENTDINLFRPLRTTLPSLYQFSKHNYSHVVVDICTKFIQSEKKNVKT